MKTRWFVVVSEDDLFSSLIHFLLYLLVRCPDKKEWRYLLVGNWMDG